MVGSRLKFKGWAVFLEEMVRTRNTGISRSYRRFVGYYVGIIFRNCHAWIGQGKNYSESPCLGSKCMRGPYMGTLDLENSIFSKLPDGNLFVF